jgi:hypothetical protein
MQLGKASSACYLPYLSALTIVSPIRAEGMTSIGGDRQYFRLVTNLWM